MVVTANGDPAVSAAPVSGAPAGGNSVPGAEFAPVNGEVGPPVEAIAGNDGAGDRVEDRADGAGDRVEDRRGRCR